MSFTAQRNGNRGKNLLSGEGTLPLFLSVRMPLLYNKSEQVYKRWGDFEKAPATKATKAQNFPNSLSIYYFKISFYKNTVLSLQLANKWRNQAICCCTETAQNLHKLHRAAAAFPPSLIPPIWPKSCTQTCNFSIFFFNFYWGNRFSLRTQA